MTRDARAVTLDSMAPTAGPDLEDTSSNSPGNDLTAVESQDQSKDQPPNLEKDSSLSTPCEHSPTIQVLEQRRKRPMSDHESTTDYQGGESAGKLAFCNNN
jgi:hypothetical protein